MDTVLPPQLGHEEGQRSPEQRDHQRLPPTDPIAQETYPRSRDNLRQVVAGHHQAVRHSAPRFAHALRARVVRTLGLSRVYESVRHERENRESRGVAHGVNARSEVARGQQHLEPVPLPAAPLRRRSAATAATTRRFGPVPLRRIRIATPQR